MHISKIIIKGFRSFPSEGKEIFIKNKLNAFVGLNSSGKTAALEALKKVFGISNAEREIIRQDFHINDSGGSEDVVERSLSIEVIFSFESNEDKVIPHYFSHLVVDDVDESPYLRIRLEATWRKSPFFPEGEIDSKILFILVAEGENESDDSKKTCPSHLRQLIQVIYVPAIRKPSEQIKYATGSILHRVLQKIKWNEEFRTEYELGIEKINELFKAVEGFNTIQSTLTSFWEKFHKDERYKESNLSFGSSDHESVLKKLEIIFSPTGTHRNFKIDDLGEGYRSLFYLTLVCSSLELEEKIDEEDPHYQFKPLLTILAVEEPENHIAPQLLGRVINQLKCIAEQGNTQVFLSSHTPSIIKRIAPEAIFHFRINEKYQTEVSSIPLPNKIDEAYKYIKEAIQNYPEIYFAKLVVIGEGDSEELIFNRLTQVYNTDFDDNIITFAPLGHRFVNHIWTLLETLNIPYITLLDLDNERDGGGWGRIKYALKQLLKTGVSEENLLRGAITLEDLEGMHKYELKNEVDVEILNSWKGLLEDFNVFFSGPLDIDFLMLTHYTDYYKAAIPESGGPRIPIAEKDPQGYQLKLASSIQATLKSEKALGTTYSIEEKELMIWYNYHFLGRGKPSTHIQVLSQLSNGQLKEAMPEVFNKIFESISKALKIGLYVNTKRNVAASE